MSRKPKMGMRCGGKVGLMMLAAGIWLKTKLFCNLRSPSLSLALSPSRRSYSHTLSPVLLFDLLLFISPLTSLLVSYLTSGAIYVSWGRLFSYGASSLIWAIYVLVWRVLEWRRRSILLLAPSIGGAGKPDNDRLSCHITEPHATRDIASTGSPLRHKRHGP